MLALRVFYCTLPTVLHQLFAFVLNGCLVIACRHTVCSCSICLPVADACPFFRWWSWTHAWLTVSNMCLHALWPSIFRKPNANEKCRTQVWSVCILSAAYARLPRLDKTIAEYARKTSTNAQAWLSRIWTHYPYGLHQYTQHTDSPEQSQVL